MLDLSVPRVARLVLMYLHYSGHLQRLIRISYVDLHRNGPPVLD